MTAAGGQGNLHFEQFLESGFKTKDTDFPTGKEALKSECVKLNEENQLLKRCLRLMRDNSALECATLLSAVISFCDGKFKRKFAEGLESLATQLSTAGEGAGFGTLPVSSGPFSAGLADFMKSSETPVRDFEMVPERDTPVPERRKKKQKRRKSGSPGKKTKLPDDYRTHDIKSAAEHQKNYTLPSDPDSQHVRSHVITHTPIKSDLEYDPLYLKSRVLREGYIELMKGDTITAPPVFFPWRQHSTGTLVSQICNTFPGILFHSKRICRRKGQKAHHSCYERTETPITPFSRLGGRVPTRKPQKRLYEPDLRTMGSSYSKTQPPPVRYPKPNQKKSKKPMGPSSDQPPLPSGADSESLLGPPTQGGQEGFGGPGGLGAETEIEPEPGYDYRSAINPIIAQAQKSLDVVSGVPPVADPDALTSYMVRHEHTDTTYLPDGTAKVVKDTHHKSYHWAEEENEGFPFTCSADEGCRMPRRGPCDHEDTSNRVSSSTPPRTDSEYGDVGPQLTSSEDFAQKMMNKELISKPASMTPASLTPKASSTNEENINEDTADYDGEPEPDPDRQSAEGDEAARDEQNRNNQRFSPFYFAKRFGDPSLGYYGDMTQFASLLATRQHWSEKMWEAAGDRSPYHPSETYSESETKSAGYRTPSRLSDLQSESGMRRVESPVPLARTLFLEPVNSPLESLKSQISPKKSSLDSFNNSRSQSPSMGLTKGALDRMRSPNIHSRPCRAGTPVPTKITSLERLKCPNDLVELEEVRCEMRKSPQDQMRSPVNAQKSASFSPSYSDASIMQVANSSPRSVGLHQYQNVIPAALAYSGRNMLGEVAFQLERRILDYVFAKCLPDADLDSSGAARSRRFYGYTVYNIGEMINREALAGDHYSRGTERMLRERLRTLLDILTPMGYDLIDHGRFSQDTINKYGLLSHPPAAKANDIETEVGIPGVTVEDVQNFIAHMTDTDYESQNLLLIFDCLRMLAIEDGRHLFVW